MAKRQKKASLSRSQGRPGWSVIFRHPVLCDASTGKPGQRIRRGLGTRDKPEASRLTNELTQLLQDSTLWEPSARSEAERRFDSKVVDIFYDKMIPENNELASRLIQSVRDAFENRNLSTMTYREMSCSLFSELDRLAEDLGVDIRRRKKKGEFLYDVCFLVTGGIRDPEGYFTSATPLRQTLLVLECEWTPKDKDKLYDFSKLLIPRSELRSFVFYTNSYEKFDAIMQDVKALIAAFKQGAQSDRYLICGLASDQLRFVLLDGRGNELYSRFFGI